MLKMLYKAKGMTPDPSRKGCFSDVIAGSWYEEYVCDAVSHEFVSGYDGGKSFKPARPVSRSEALKMIYSVFELAMPSFADDFTGGTYSDVPVTEWFSDYVHAALYDHILPIPGQDGGVFRPHTPLERGEAAAYIRSALQVKGREESTIDVPAGSDMASSSSESGVSGTKTKTAASSSAPATGIASKRAAQRAGENKSLQEDLQNTKRVGIPFGSSDAFKGLHIRSYKFTMRSAQTVQITAGLTSGGGRAKCRLFHLAGDAPPTEYYVGIEAATGCLILAGLAPGDYQLDVQPTEADAVVRVDATVATGDGNDGFPQAKALKIGQKITDMMEGSDLADWFTFTIAPRSSRDAPGERHTVTLTGGSNNDCVIFPGANVDLFGFNGPVCNEEYPYMPGTYTVSVRRVPPMAERQSYTVELK